MRPYEMKLKRKNRRIVLMRLEWKDVSTVAGKNTEGCVRKYAPNLPMVSRREMLYTEVFRRKFMSNHHREYR
jgi:hypothetical protein